MTGAEKAEEFTWLLSHWPSLLMTCMSRQCSLASYLYEQYPEMITLEWTLSIRGLKVEDRGVFGGLVFGARLEYVFVPWSAIVSLRPWAHTTMSEESVRPSKIPAGWALIKGGRA